MQDFIAGFRFNPDFEGFLGVEREYWTVAPGTKDLIVVAPSIFAKYPEGKIKPELPVHQLEITTSPSPTIKSLSQDLNEIDATLRQWGQEFQFDICMDALPPSDFAVEVYPKPRYIEILDMIGAEHLRNGWITSVHVHYGCKDFDQAIRLLNGLRLKLEYFSSLSTFGKKSERLEIYKKMCSEITPPVIESREHFYEIAVDRGFSHDARSCWWGLRINPCGTVEVRIFDNHPDLDVPYIANEVKRASLEVLR